MNRRTFLYAARAVSVMPAIHFAFGKQRNGQRLSPHETVSGEIGGKKFSIFYGRPYLKGRQVGNEVAPFGKVWRLGADEATKLTLASAAEIGNGLKLPAGSYSLFAIPGSSEWTMIVNKTADQWGAFDYDSKQDMGRFTVPVQKLSTPAEQFTISVDKQNASMDRLTFVWGLTSVTTSLRA